MAWRRLSLRAAAKSSRQGKSMTLAPCWAAISFVASVEPVSTTMISSTSVGHRAQALAQAVRFVLDDHREADTGHGTINPKFEARNPKQAQMTKSANYTLGHPPFESRALNLFRISDFGFRASTTGRRGRRKRSRTLLHRFLDREQRLAAERRRLRRSRTCSACGCSGRSNMMSSITCSMIDRRPRAPVPLSIAFGGDGDAGRCR